MVFRTISERERLARLITANLLLCRHAAPAARYEPQPLVLDRKTQERVREFPVVELASELHEAFVVVLIFVVVFFCFCCSFISKK